MKKVVFVRFVAKNYGDKDIYFAGDSLQSIMNDTKDGKSFGLYEFSSFTEVSEEEVRALRLEYFEKGLYAVRNNNCRSYLIG
ncbi:hypothetical protein C0584_04135 [Candidatus Parcubacteria bacterium]|nr:MAG: hypothetical protein C0584_04135 [Candidatus Parcubacteria bacterium]